MSIIVEAPTARCLDQIGQTLPVPAQPLAHPAVRALRVVITLAADWRAPVWLDQEALLFTSDRYQLFRIGGDPVVLQDGIGWGRLYRGERRIQIEGVASLASDAYYLGQLFFMALLPAAMRLW